jgi:DNA-binding GntR family transcriptional regulator
MNEAITQPLTLTLPLQIADRIGAAIVDDHFAEGQRLIEVELAASFGVSRATVREALRILEKRGLVSILPQRGARVTSLSRKELEEMFEIREVLMGLASRRIAESFTPEAKRRLIAVLKALEEGRPAPRAYARASEKASREIILLSGNPQLTDHLTMFAQRIGRYTPLGLLSQERRDQSFSNWRKLFQAMAAGDGNLAETIQRRLARENWLAALAELDRREKADRTKRDKRTHQRRAKAELS